METSWKEYFERLQDQNPDNCFITLTYNLGAQTISSDFVPADRNYGGLHGITIRPTKYDIGPLSDLLSIGFKLVNRQHLQENIAYTFSRDSPYIEEEGGECYN